MNSDDEYEYEYDEIETETFFIDLDLSSLNGIAKPSKPRRTLRQTSDISNKAFNGAGLGVFDPKDQQPKSTPGRKPKRGQKNSPNFQQGPTSLQILDLDSINPIVSYREQIYSCNWTDMVGTNMYFSAPANSTVLGTSSPSTDQSLIGTSRIKLLGQRAKLSGVDVRKRPSEDADAVEGQDSLAVSLPKQQMNPATQKQAHFLERLAEVERHRLENERGSASASAETPALLLDQATTSHIRDSKASSG